MRFGHPTSRVSSAIIIMLLKITAIRFLSTYGALSNEFIINWLYSIEPCPGRLCVMTITADINNSECLAEQQSLLPLQLTFCIELSSCQKYAMRFGCWSLFIDGCRLESSILIVRLKLFLLAQTPPYSILNWLRYAIFVILAFCQISRSKLIFYFTVKPFRSHYPDTKYFDAVLRLTRDMVNWNFLTLALWPRYLGQGQRPWHLFEIL